MNLEEVVHKGWFNMIQLNWPTLWKIKVNGNSLLEFVCNGDGFRDMHLLKFIIMVRNSTSLFLVSKWSCPCTCANPFHHDVPCLCMAPHLKFMIAIPNVEHLPQQLGEVQVPPQKLFEPIILLPPYKTPWISKFKTIFSWNCQFVGDMKNTFLAPYTPFGLMSISSSRHQSWKHDDLLTSYSFNKVECSFHLALGMNLEPFQHFIGVELVFF